MAEDRARGKLYEWSVLHRLAVIMAPAGFIAVIAGWVTTEVGRQPFTVYHMLRISESVSPIASPAVTGSLIALVVVYFTTFVSGAIYMVKLMAQPPRSHETATEGLPIRSAGITAAPAVGGGESH